LMLSEPIINGGTVFAYEQGKPTIASPIKKKPGALTGSGLRTGYFLVDN
jgi:hypothetical protein